MTLETPRKIWKIEKPGNIDQLKLVDDILPAPSDSEVRVKVKYVGLNFADVFTVLGMYDAAPRDQAVVPGLEFCGIVESIGNARVSATSSNPLREGDRVMGVTRFGAFATHINVGSNFIRKVPDSWTAEQGAGFVVQALTAWYGLVELGAAARGKLALVHSAAGGVGLHALQVCRMLGMEAVGVVGSEEKAAWLRHHMDLPHDQVVVRPRDAASFALGIRRAAAAAGRAQGYDIIMDSVAGRYFAPGFESLAPAGRHVLFGAATFTPKCDVGLSPWTWEFWSRTVPQFLSRPRVDVQRMIGQNRAVMGFNLIWLTDGHTDPERLGRMIDEMLRAGVWRPPTVDRCFDFSEAPEALRYFKSGSNIGKVVLRVS